MNPGSFFVALHINNWSSGPILIPVERQVHRKKQKNMSKKDDGKTFCCYNGMQ